MVCNWHFQPSDIKRLKSWYCSQRKFWSTLVSWLVSVTRKNLTNDHLLPMYHLTCIWPPEFQFNLSHNTCRVYSASGNYSIIKLLQLKNTFMWKSENMKFFNNIVPWTWPKKVMKSESALSKYQQNYIIHGQPCSHTGLSSNLYLKNPSL